MKWYSGTKEIEWNRITFISAGGQCTHLLSEFKLNDEPYIVQPELDTYF